MACAINGLRDRATGSPSQPRKASHEVRAPLPVAIEIQGAGRSPLVLRKESHRAQTGPSKDPQASDERCVHLGSAAKALQAFFRTRTGGPFLTMATRLGPRVLPRVNFRFAIGLRRTG